MAISYDWTTDLITSSGSSLKMNSANTCFDTSGNLAFGSTQCISNSSALSLTGTGAVYFDGGSASNKAFVVPKCTADQTACMSGQVYYNTTSNIFKGYNGSSWIQLAYLSGTTTCTVGNGVVYNLCTCCGQATGWSEISGCSVSLSLGGACTGNVNAMTFTCGVLTAYTTA